METKNKLERGNEIIEKLKEHNMRLRYFADDAEYLEYHIEDDNVDYKELEKYFGSIVSVYSDEEKEGRECIEITIVHFEDYELYIKEISVGECHYKDVAIDGDYESTFLVVEPKEVKRIDYIELK